MKVASANTLGTTLSSKIAQIRAWWITTVTSQNWIVQLGMWALLGFILGFIIKYLGKPLFWLLVGAVLTLYLLHVLQVAVIDYRFLLQALDFTPDITLEGVGQALVQWVTLHKGESLALVIGFFIGWQLT
jgi:uncharacterized membrane protein (Fun14 family)